MTQLARPDPARSNGSNAARSQPPVNMPAARWLADAVSADAVPVAAGTPATRPPGPVAAAITAPSWMAAAARSASSSTAVPAAGRLTPVWVVLCALLTPVLLVAGWLV